MNLASLAGKSPQPWLSVYSATKAAVVAYTTAMSDMAEALRFLLRVSRTCLVPEIVFQRPGETS